MPLSQYLLRGSGGGSWNKVGRGLKKQTKDNTKFCETGDDSTKWLCLSTY